MFEAELDIDKPVAEVYAAFNHRDNLPRWLTGLQRTEQISGEPGEVGSKSRQIYLERGRTVEMIETITEHVPEQRFAGHLDGPGMQAEIEVEFVDLGEHTKLRMRSRMVSRSFAMRLMLPFMRGSVHRRQEGDLRRFKTMLENGELLAG